MRWQHVPNLRCRDAETARTITRGPSIRGTIMSSLSAERSRERKGTETIGEQMSRKYTGDRPWMQSYVILSYDLFVRLFYLCRVCISRIVHLPLYDDDADNEDGHAHDERQTNHNSDRQFCKHITHRGLRNSSGCLNHVNNS